LAALRGIRWIKVLVFALCFWPLGALAWRGYQQDLTANPIEFITHATGDWTLRFLLITLAITPLRRITGMPDLIRFRRMLGLFAFFYGVLHLITWAWLDRFFDPQEMWADVLKRRFITAGMAGFLAMLPLAFTSTAGWIRRLGGRAWQRLHRLIYVSAAAGVVHYYWLVKSDIREPLLYGSLLGILLAYRAAVRLAKAPQRARSGARPSPEPDLAGVRRYSNHR
jgi:sulfoxide reductase heme-binding subunit YedZ